MAGSDVNETCAGGVLNEIVARIKFAGAIAERMLVLDLFQVLGIERANDFVVFPMRFLSDGFQEDVGNDIRFITDLNERVIKGGVVGDCEIRGERPGGGRPDEDERIRMTHERELHVDALADVIGVFDFSISKCGAAGNAPVNGFLAAINEALIDDIGEHAEFIRFVFLIESKIWILPVAENAEAFKLRALKIDELARVSIASFADRGGVARGVAGFAHFLRDLEFDRKAMAIPTRDIRSAFAAERLILDDDVLENFIQGGADVDITVSKRRAVMQDKFIAVRARALDALVEL